jgi:hypothetical protein
MYREARNKVLEFNLKASLSVPYKGIFRFF